MATTEGGRRVWSGRRKPTPLVSIVVVIYNDADPLRKLLASIAPQESNELEVVVIDGGSKDQTLACIKEFERYIDYWRSEPDQGIYDAMNKGIAFATGSYILHLNAGDRLLKIPYAELKKCLTEGVEVACFEVLMSNGATFSPRSDLLLRIDNAWHHQGTFYLRQSHPGYDLRYPVYADFDLNQKLILRHANVRAFAQLVAEFTLNGASMVMGTHRERYRIIRKNFGATYLLMAFIRYQLNDFRRQLREYKERRQRVDRG